MVIVDAAMSNNISNFLPPITKVRIKKCLLAKNKRVKHWSDVLAHALYVVVTRVQYKSAACIIFNGR